MSETPKAAMFCQCDYNLPELAKAGDVLVHTVCGLPVECEFSHMVDEDEVHAATQIHIDYVICDEHLSAAIDNVASR